MPRVDIFETWKKNHVLEDKLNLITNLVGKRSTQLMISQQLGISSKTFITLRDKHKEIRDAIAKGEDMLLNNILDAIYKRAVGYETEDEVTTYEIVGDRKKQRIVKTKKVYPPDIDACKYLLMIKFGREYSPRKFELEILEKKTAEAIELWPEDK